jgi:ABC-type cobalamin/Fe3+-siderophores transport system ATPase subunit
MSSRCCIADWAHASPVIVMDEPTNFLEYRARVRVAHLLGKLAGRKLVIFSTHEVEWLTYFPNATCWVLNRSKEIHVLKNPDELVENTRLEPIFGGVFRAVSVTDARSSSPSRKILYFEESASSAIRAPL